MAWVVLGVLQPAVHTSFGVIGGLSGAISNPISGLGVGPQADLFNAAFVVCGLMQLGGIVAALHALAPERRSIWREICAGMLSISPFGLAMAGVFTLASALLLHILAGMLVFATPIASFAVAGVFLRRSRDWKQLGNALLIASPVTLLLFVLYSVSFDQAQTAAGLGVAGLTERVLMLEIQAWYVVMGWLAFHRSPTAYVEQPDVL
jgi:hypothetical membrane protein